MHLSCVQLIIIIFTMQEINLAGVDLNLLVLFDALMAERNVTRAASRVGLTQPAASHALARLRDLFGDALFVRTPKGMAPTALAVEAAGPIRSALDQIREVLASEQAFDPARSDRIFTVGLSDYAAFLILPGLLERIQGSAPNVRLVVRNTNHVSGLSMIDSGDVELIIGNFPDPPLHMSEDFLYMEAFVCAGRRDHPDIADKLDIDAYLGLRHLHVSLKGEPQGYIDDILRSRGMHRNVAVTVGHFLIAPFLLASTDAIATEPRRILEPLAEMLNLKIVSPPLDIPPFKVTQIWHKRCDSDPGHNWLRNRVRDICAAFNEKTGQGPKAASAGVRSVPKPTQRNSG
jgi:DNA-binding transcriptional LysR family regulator